MKNFNKLFLVLFVIFINLSFISSQENIEIDFIEKTFKPSEDITFKVILRDSESNIVHDDVDIVLEDIDKQHRIEKTINTKDIVNINLEEKGKSGEWKITAKKDETETTKSFFIESKEEMNISINNRELIIENTGNIKIDKQIQIMIGDEKGEPKNLNLDIGEKETYGLIAPEGKYNIKVISEEETLFSTSNVQLQNTGFTGEAIGAINKEQSEKTPFTGGISPEKEDNDAMLSFMRNNKIVYTFMLIIFGAAVLLAIERKYSAMKSKNSK